jgi:hypothetical protein
LSRSPRGHPGYVEDLRKIEGDAGSLVDRLDRSLYLVLQNDPKRGTFSRTWDLWVIRFP